MTHHMGMGGTVTTKNHAAGTVADDTPTKKLSRSPKPLTLLQAYDEAAHGGYDAREARRSSPGLFKATNHAKQPAGAAHAAARANRDTNNADPNATLLAFRERMRAAEASSNVPTPAAAQQQQRQRANSARRSRPVPQPRQPMVPAPPPPGPPSRPVSRGGAAVRAASPRNTTRMDASIGGGAASARGGGGFRSRKYNQPGNNNTGRINALISAR